MVYTPPPSAAMLSRAVQSTSATVDGTQLVRLRGRLQRALEWTFQDGAIMIPPPMEPVSLAALP